MMQAFRLDIGKRRFFIVFLSAFYVVLFQFEICRADPATSSVTCGKDYDNTLCQGSNECCSNYGYCGTTSEYCGSGCQSGNCIAGAPPLLPGACGQIGNQTVNCINNLCCSANGYCGITSAYCGHGCQGGPCLFPTSNSLSAGVYAGIAVGIVAATLIVLVAALFVFHRRRRRREAVKSVEDGHQLSVGANLYSQNSKLHLGGVKLSFETLETATNGFSTELGRGAFGVVYKGTMKDETRVAVKRLVNNERGLKDFEAEVKTLGSINHGNLVALLGYCFERNQPFLIYEYVANGSLDKWIFTGKDKADPEFVLPWKTRVDIAKGTAKGLAYLHEDLQIGQAIIHLDVKPENILLSESFAPKVADFGMAKLLGSKKSQTLASGGTIGYMAPEVYIGAATSKMDVYSFGIVLLEILSGRRHLDHSKAKDGFYLPSWAVRRVAQGEELDVIDPRLEEEEFDAKEAKRLILVALLCLQRDPDHRPEMGSVLRMMDGITIPQLPPPGLQSELEMTERLIRRGMAAGKDDKDSCFIDLSSICEEAQRVGARPLGKQSRSSQRPLLLASSSLLTQPCDPIAESPNAELPDEEPTETKT